MSRTGQAALRHHLPDLARHAQTMTATELARHYGIPRSTMGGWLKTLNITAAKAIRTVRHPVKPLDGIETLCQTMNKTQLAKHYHIRLETVTKRLFELGLDANKQRLTDLEAALPDIHALAKTMHQAALARHYGVSTGIMARRLDALAISPAEMPKSIPPVQADRYPDLDELATTMHISAIARHYGVSASAIHKALRKRGLVAAPPPKAPPRLKSPRPKAVRAAPYKLVPHATPFTDRRVKSSADLAAEWLQKECAVYHCDEVGRPDPKGKFYRRGRAVLTPDEVVSRAQAKGWNPRGWMECAA